MRFSAGGMQPFGALLGGALATAFGVPATLVVAALGMLLAVLWLYLSPVRNLRDLPPVAA
jgi:predicted MFS family arabinose efflux permease